MPTIEERLARLERANRRLICVAALAVAALVMGAAAPPGPLRATSLDIVDDHGRNRVRLNTGRDDNAPQITLWGDTEDTRATLVIEEHGPTLRLSTHPETGIMLTATDEEAAGVFIGPKSPGIMTIANTATRAQVLILDENGKTSRFPER